MVAGQQGTTFCRYVFTTEAADAEGEGEDYLAESPPTAIPKSVRSKITGESNKIFVDSGNGSIGVITG